MAKKTKSKPRPVENLKAYPVQAAIWKNDGDKGAFFSVTFSRSYKTDDGYRDVDSYSGAQLLQLARLAGHAYDRVETLTREARQTNGAGTVDDLDDEIPF